LIADPIQNHLLGRRGAIALSAFINVIATIGICFSQTLPQIFGCRIVVGATLGPKASVIAPFIAEMSPVHLRGALLSTW
jgi:MFS family permease